LHAGDFEPTLGTISAQLFAEHQVTAGCAYQKVDPLANWHVPTDNIRLAGRQTPTA